MDKIKLEDLSEFHKNTYNIINKTFTREDIIGYSAIYDELTNTNNYLMNEYPELSSAIIWINPFPLRVYDFVIKFPHLVDDKKADEIKKKTYTAIPQLESLISK